jgi:hypothetical protein
MNLRFARNEKLRKLNVELKNLKPKTYLNVVPKLPSYLTRNKLCLQSITSGLTMVGRNIILL